jgi:ribokinase
MSSATKVGASVVVVGSANVDLVVQAPRHPEPGETLIGTGFATHPGGKGANQAVAVGRAGSSVSMIGRVGPDSGAALLRETLTDAHVDITAIGTCKHDPTGTALITVSSVGENTIVVVPGANSMLRPVHIEDAANTGVFGAAKVVLCQLEIPLDCVVAAFTAARSVGARTILNAAPAQVLTNQVLDLVDVLVVNETELAVAGGSALTDPAQWHPLGSVSTIVLTLGDRGVVFGTPGTGEGSGSLAGYKVNVVDTTAAGDTFCGYLAAGLALGQSVGDACAVANAAAALACTKAGAQPSIPTADEVEFFLLSGTS